MHETHPETRLIGYARVSTYGQTLDSELEQLRAAGCTSRNIYREKATGARPDRRELNRMLGKLGCGDASWSPCPTAPQPRYADRQTLRSLIKVSGQFETSVGVGLKSDDRGDGTDIERSVYVRIEIAVAAVLATDICRHQLRIDHEQYQVASALKQATGDLDHLLRP
jgi:hypothetical protein